MSEVFRSKDSDEIENAESVLAKAEVIQAIGHHVENYSLQRELADENGIYLYEVTIPGEKPGEVTEYTYQRKGSFGELQTTTTQIRVAYYEDGEPVGGKVIANYDEKTGQWK